MLTRVKDRQQGAKDQPPARPREDRGEEGEEERERRGSEEDEEEEGERRGAGGAGDVRARRADELDSIRRDKRAYGKMQAAGFEVRRLGQGRLAGLPRERLAFARLPDGRACAASCYVCCVCCVRCVCCVVQVADATLLKPWQVSRERYKKRKQIIGGREKDTLSRLASFTAKLHGGTGSAGASAQVRRRRVPRSHLRNSTSSAVQLPPARRRRRLPLRGVARAQEAAAEADKGAAAAEEQQGGYDGKVRTDIDHKAYMPPSWRVRPWRLPDPRRRVRWFRSFPKGLGSGAHSAALRRAAGG